MSNPVRNSREFVVQRLKGGEPLPERAILQVAQIISCELSIPPLRYDLESGHLIELSETEIAKWIAQLDQQKRLGRYKAYGLTDNSTEPTTYLLWRRKWLPKPIEEIAFFIPDQTPLDLLIKVVEQICLEFGAFYAYTDNHSLNQLHVRSLRAYERWLTQLPPERHKSLLKPEPVEGVVDTLPALLLKDEFDFIHIPNGVWWINYWSPLQTKAIGMEYIRTANWERLLELPNEGLILAVTEEPLDVTNSDHMAKLGEIVEHINLRELQEYYRINT